MTHRSVSIRTSTVSKLLAPAVLLLPTAARADWGDSNWGELVWGNPTLPLVPTLDPWLLFGVAALLMLSGAVWLRRSSRVVASGSACVLLLLAPGRADATQITLPFTFVNGTLADADDVNANFATLESESNAQDLRIGFTEGDITLLQGDVVSLDGRVTTLEGHVPGDITGVSAGTGLTGGGLSGDVTLNADLSSVQARVSGSCPAGQSIRAIDGAGGVTCEFDDNSGGDITGVTASTGLSGGGTAGAVSLALDTSYADGRYVNATGDSMTGNLSTTGKLGVGRTAASNVTLAVRQADPGDTYLLYLEDDAAAFQAYLSASGTLLTQGSLQTNGALYVGGNGQINTLGIGTGAPATKLQVIGGGDASLSDGSGYLVLGPESGGNLVLDNNEIIARNNEGGAPLYLNNGTNQPVIVPILQITGGADLAEPFDFHGTAAVEPGMVVAIDRDNPGQLRVSDTAYDRTVAGIISGANGINAGLTLSQEGSIADGSHPVALTGRVYARADASSGSIEPGDLLTTSDTPGHLMRVVDHQRAQGAILGKAMTTLEDGTGMVLVLVSLQ